MLNYIMSGTSISPNIMLLLVLECCGNNRLRIRWRIIHIAASGNYESNRETSIITLVLLIVGAVCGLLAIGRISLVSKRYFSKLVDAQDQTSLSSD